jgi:ABC-2 type transport system ATP-binding protein
MSIAALELHNVTHAFGARQVLTDVSMSVPSGAFSVILGPNGAGKTTLFCVIARLYHPRSGTVAIYGRDLRRDPLGGLAELGIVFQQPTLDPDLTVAENLAYFAGLHAMSRAEARSAAAAELARAGLGEFAHRMTRTLSGGERRRAEIARALMPRPRLLLLDEPTTGLDPQSRSALLVHVRELCAREGISVLWATHLLDEVRPTDEVFVLDRGRLAPRNRPSDRA